MQRPGTQDVGEPGALVLCRSLLTWTGPKHGLFIASTDSCCFFVPATGIREGLVGLGCPCQCPAMNHCSRRFVMAALPYHSGLLQVIPSFSR